MKRTILNRTLTLAYGAICYVVFFATFLYAIGFIGNLVVPKSIDSGRTGSLGEALLIDALLLGVFAVQHSLMARPWFKRAWTRIVPEAAERSTYVLLSSLCLILLFWKWEPIGGVIWEIENLTALLVVNALYVAGVLLILVATFLTNHFDLFGLRQVWFHFRNQPYQPIGFRTPGLYKLVRHPLYVGWFLMFWSAPVMSAAHLVFTLATSAYILIAIRFEEHDLVTVHGEAYQQYRRDVGMLTPRLARPARMAVKEELRTH